jgi:acetolactate synthase-1/3 small subunit
LRLSITTKSTQEHIETLLKQLRRLFNVIKVRAMADDDSVRRESARICVKAVKDKREEIRSIVETFRAKIVEI